MFFFFSSDLTNNGSFLQSCAQFSNPSESLIINFAKCLSGFLDHRILLNIQLQQMHLTALFALEKKKLQRYRIKKVGSQNSLFIPI